MSGEADKRYVDNVAISRGKSHNEGKTTSQQPISSYGRMGGGKSPGGESSRTDSGSSKRGYITIEDVYPFASIVAPKIYKENLSSGRALITRKVDNWMTFEEYTKYTE